MASTARVVSEERNYTHAGIEGYLSPLRYRSPDSIFRGHRRTKGWLERGQPEAQRWLRDAALDGNCFAMLKLGERLLDGDGIQQCTEEGLHWLRKAAADNYIPAMENLGIRLLDSEQQWQSHEGGLELLSKAANLDHATAAFDLGDRYLKADGVPLDVGRGIGLLRHAAELGDRLAMVVLGRSNELQSEIGSDEREYWTICAGATKPEMIPKLGRYSYSRACLAVTNKVRWRIATEAADLFAAGLHVNSADSYCALNLAYLLRRNEVSDTRYLSFDELIRGLLQQANPAALVNQAIRLASGYRCEVDWRAADNLFKSLRGTLGILEWWLSRAREGDAEGHLVVAWLMRMSLTTEIDGLNLGARISIAREAFPDIPGWLHEVSSYTGATR